MIWDGVYAVYIIVTILLPTAILNHTKYKMDCIFLIKFENYLEFRNKTVMIHENVFACAKIWNVERFGKSDGLPAP